MASIKEALDKFGRKCWRVRIRIEGFDTISKTLGAPDFLSKKQAQDWAMRQELVLKERKRTIEAGIITGKPLNEAIEHYKTHKTFKGHGHRGSIHLALDWWASRFGDVDMADVTPVMVAQGRDELLFVDYAPGTVKKFLQALSGLYAMGNDLGWVKGSPEKDVKRPTEPRARVRYLADDELTTLLKEVRRCANPALPVIVMLALCTGARRGELLNLKWADVDFARRRVYLMQTKTDKPRAAHLIDQALASLKTYAEAVAQKTYVFESKDGRPLNISRTWQRIIKRAKLDDFHFHDLRHSAASFLAMNGVPTVQIADILGHKTLAMVGRYAHLSEDSNRQALEAMADKFLKPLFDSTPKRPPLKRVK
jgi:integrase